MPAQTGQRYSLANYYVSATLKHFLLQGGDLGALLDRARISRDLMDAGDARISPEQYSRLQANTMVMMDDEILGYTGKPMRLGTFRIMCHAVITAETLAEALDRYREFYNLIDWGVRTEVWEEGDKTVFRIESTTPEPLERFPMATYMTNTFRFFSWLGEQFLPVSEFHFACPRPEHHADYRGIYVGTPVHFDKPDYRMEIVRKHLSGPLKQDVTSLRRFLRHPIYELAILDYKTELLSSKIRKIIESDLSNPPAFATLAEQLEVHPQSLRRRLAEEGTNYREIKNKTRFDTAIYYLGKRDLSVERVAERAGFSEASAFIRAFKSWTGVSPDQYRRQSSKN